MKSLARERDQAEIFARLGQLRPDSVRRWGRMSVHQMVCHLADANRMALGQKAATAPCGLLQRTVVKWVALYAPMRWPPGIVTSPELDQLGVVATPPSAFAADLAEVEALLRLMLADTRSLTRPHPVFGPMSEAAWLRWAYLHTDHHLRQFGV
jgi:hypothetical protein